MIERSKSKGTEDRERLLVSNYVTLDAPYKLQSPMNLAGIILIITRILHVCSLYRLENGYR